jgi:hypothetical protein
MMPLPPNAERAAHAAVVAGLCGSVDHARRAIRYWYRVNSYTMREQPPAGWMRAMLVMLDWYAETHRTRLVVVPGGANERSESDG